MEVAGLVHRYFLSLATGYVVSLALVGGRGVGVGVGAGGAANWRLWVDVAGQFGFMQLYMYWVHRLLHRLPNTPLNAHIYMHHQKSIPLPRPLELAASAVFDLLGFAPVLLLPWIHRKILALTALWFVTVHAFNYSALAGPEHSHKEHHGAQEVNFAPAYADWLFGTLSPAAAGETMNDTVVNYLALYFLLRAW